MAYAAATQTLVDTVNKAVVHVDAEDTDGTAAMSATTIFDSSASKYAQATLTLSAVTTLSDRWCIGEIISSNDGSPIHMVVQNQVLGTDTMTVYRCTSGTDATPLGWSGTTLPGTGKTLTGSVSGTHTITTDGTDASAFVTRSVEVTAIRWNTTGQITLQYAGGTAQQDIAHLAGNGVWDETNHFYPIGMGAAAGGATLGDITIAAGAAAANHCTVQVVIKKLNGYDTPNYEGNAMLGYNAYAAGNFM